MLFYCDCQEFNLTGGFVFSVHGDQGGCRGIFICSAGLLGRMVVTVVWVGEIGYSPGKREME